MKTITRIAASATLVLLIALAIRATIQLSKVNAAMAALAPQRTQLHEATVRMESRLQSAREALLKSEQNSVIPAAESGSAKREPRGASAASDAPDKPATPTRQLKPATVIANDPQKRAEYSKNFRAGVAWTYGGMFKALGLSPEQIEKFKDVEVWLREAEMDLEAAADTLGLSRDSAEYRKLYSEYDKSRAPKKREVLGDLADKYFEYYWTLNPREVAQRLAWTGVFTGEPVTATQVERAADVLIANSRRQENLPGVWPSTVNWATASTQLGSILSPTQTEMLGQLVETDKALRKYYYENSRLTRQFKGQMPAR